MKKLFALILIVLSILSLTTQEDSILSRNCINHDIPTKFGILTTTYIRSRSTDMLNRYLKQYAESECDAYDNIYIIWNNEQSPEQMGVLANKDKWKKNVYFMQTVENSLDFKYIVPTWAKEKVFFGMDDDFTISCETLKKGFQAWQQQSYGQIGPITSLYGRSFVFQPKTQTFSYIDQVKLNKQWNYFHFGLTGIAFISRHFLQLYYADISQLREMRKHVVEKFNCEDLLLNFMVSALYPEITPKYIELPFISLGFTGVSASSTHKSYRAECIKKFSQIIGYNPIRYVLARKDPELMAKKTDLQQGCIVNLKQEHYQKKFISNRAYYLYIKRITGVDNDFIRDENVRLLEAKENIVEFMEKRKQEMRRVDLNLKAQINALGLNGDGGRRMITEDEMMMHYGSQEQIDKLKSQIPEKQLQPLQTSEVVTKENPLQLKQELNQEIQEGSQISQNQSQFEKSKQLIIAKIKETVSDQLEFVKQNEKYFIYLGVISFAIVALFCVKRCVFKKKPKYQTVPVGLANDN